ncbi:hypothetical protein M409DRAFT_25385 [Zasmidium cellare ATCC 36951]|uniref:Uncharacterized protein n=1 Tax=Zasmidium cellare ATCC 36951 TaxID=1080233 RepID=A0A6A6CEB3_ZASCE|nr:uncharacterized protein M409DRAFT_25385 [Zasmidium cellare ATCC 36951]KAF2164508.1 hypothetical protein M409DRAFT_25385 [Zasmidium cellare ATCC 36951]
MTSCTVKLDFGGDFKSWSTEMSSILQAKQLSRISWFNPKYGLMGKLGWQESLHASLAIFSEVEPYLLGRVPVEDRFDAPRLLAHLQKLCWPFRLLSLPAELRNRIYDLYFQSKSFGNKCRGVLVVSCYLDGRYRLPPLTYVSRQIRAESLSLLVGTTSFKSLLPPCYDWEGAQHANRLVRAWVVDAAGAYFRYLRTVYFHIYSFWDCILTFSDRHGLTIDFTDTRNEQVAEHQQKLVSYIKGLEEDRKALNLKGESIVLAMIKEPNVWIFEEDEDEDE